MDYVMVIATPIFAQLMLKSLLSLAIDLSKAIIQFGRGGHRLPVGWLSPISPTALPDKQTETKWGKMWQNRCCFVILCGCYHGFNFPSFCRLTALLCLISFFFYRQVTCNWLERERERAGRGKQMEREQRGREWARESGTREIPC